MRRETPSLIPLRREPAGRPARRSGEAFLGAHPVASRRGSRRDSGIALLVVLVVFLVLYLVVYNLTYWTSMESQIARVRRGDSQGEDALYSMSCFLGSLLVEDLASDIREAATSGASSGMSAGMQAGPQGDGPPRGAAGAEESFVPIATGATGAQSTPITNWIDYERENVFNEVRQTIGDVEIKGRIIDNARGIDLNRLFDLAAAIRERASTGVAGGALPGVSEEDLVGAVAGATDDAAAQRNLERIARGGGTGGTARGTSRTSTSRTAGGRDEREGLDAVGEGDPALEAVASALGTKSEAELARFEEPTEEMITDAIEIVKRAIWVMISMNADRGYEYQDNYSSESVAEEIARQIVEYVIARRRSPIQNVIYDPSELLNVPLVTPELYYGPRVELAPGQELVVSSPGPDGEYYDFILTRDEFGDLTARPAPYLLPDQGWEAEEQQRALADLQETYGHFADLQGFGLGRLAGSSYTRGMEEPPVIYDENGIDGSVLDSPLPIGLKDLFCTFSEGGKININTAPVPILYAILLSLEPGLSEANDVAISIHGYRTRLQEAIDPEETTRNQTDPAPPDLGQPRRELPPTEEELQNIDPTDPEYLASLGSAYQDLETNYFTNLQQIELVDGWDGGPNDRLKKEIEAVSEEQAGLLERVIGDLTNATVFGSTYFTLDLAARLPGSPLVKRVRVVVKRDTNSKILEYLLWKELE